MKPSHKQTVLSSTNTDDHGRREKTGSYSIPRKSTVVFFVCIVCCTIGQLLVSINIDHRYLLVDTVVIAANHSGVRKVPSLGLNNVYPDPHKLPRNTTQQCAVATLDKTTRQLVPADEQECPASTRFSEKISKRSEQLESNISVQQEPKVTFLLLYYNDDRYFAHQLDSWMNYSERVLSRIRFLVVDDGSTVGQRAVELLESNFQNVSGMASLDIRVYEIDQDIDWNIGGARNLGFWIASQNPSETVSKRGIGANRPASLSWVFMNDADVLVPQQTMEFVLELIDENSQPSDTSTETETTRKETVYGFFQRIGRNGELNNKTPHPAVMLTTTESYWTAGGCDEDFVGNYGWTDPHFFYRVNNHPLLNDVNIHKRMDAMSIPPLVEMTKNYKKSCPDTLHCLPLIKSETEVKRQSLSDDGGKKRETTKPPLSKNTKINKKLYNHKTTTGEWSNKYLRFTWRQVW